MVRRVGPATPICGSNNVTYSACIEWLYADGDRFFADRIRAAAADGMTAATAFGGDHAEVHGDLA